MRRNLIVLLILFVITALVGLLIFLFSDKSESDEQQMRELAEIDSLDITILESFPVQVRANVTGVFTDDCSSIGDINEIRRDFEFFVSVKIKRESGKPCIESRVPFEYSIPLTVAGLKAGQYTVRVNSQESEFTLQTDSFLPGQQEEGEKDFNAEVRQMLELIN